MIETTLRQKFLGTIKGEAPSSALNPLGWALWKNDFESFVIENLNLESCPNQTNYHNFTMTFWLKLWIQNLVKIIIFWKWGFQRWSAFLWVEAFEVSVTGKWTETFKDIWNFNKKLLKWSVDREIWKMKVSTGHELPEICGNCLQNGS